MSAAPALANTLWLAGSLTAARRFDRALSNPRAAQEAWLSAQLRRHADSVFGREHSFASLTPREFTRTVPLGDYPAIEERIGMIANGARDVLACGPVTHLAPTSGSTGARKLIPFNAPLQEAFNAAVGPWMIDLARQRPGIVGGPAYWSISPTSEPDRSGTAVPIGFADDADYLGAARAWLVRQALAVPASIRHVTDTNDFWKQTLVALLRRRDLRLISVWHPSFLDLLVQAAVPAWPDLMSSLRSDRAAELQRVGPYDWPQWWPRLQVVSCWGEQAAEPGWRALKERLPNVLVQPKGLLATECVVTIPLGAERPLAVTSHFFEFLDLDGNARLAHELERGAQYEVVVTNGGGLWRYRLGDMVECTGFVRSTPSLRFLGRAGRVSDLRGEKLSETFVAQVLSSVFGESRSWAALRPRAQDDVAGYDLLATTDERADLAQLVDEALLANPHYALARRLGQLAPVRLVRVGPDAEARLLEQSRGRLGDAKPLVLLD